MENHSVVVLTAKELTEDDRRRLNGGIEKVLTKGISSHQRLLDEVHPQFSKRTDKIMPRILIVTKNMQMLHKICRRFGLEEEPGDDLTRRKPNETLFAARLESGTHLAVDAGFSRRLARGLFQSPGPTPPAVSPGPCPFILRFE